MFPSILRNTVVACSLLALLLSPPQLSGQHKDEHGAGGRAEPAGHTDGDHGDKSHSEEFSAIDMIMEHISDTNEWHILTYKDAEGHEQHLSIPLPVIVYDAGEWHVFMSSKLAHGHEYKGFTMHHSQLVHPEGKTKAGMLDLMGNMEDKYIDFSITKNVLSIFISCFLLIGVFTAVNRAYGKHGGVPKGIASFMEPVILFIRDDVAIPNIGEGKADKYLPLLLTIFFFIWFNNLLGLVPIFPGGANVTGNIAVTMVLALITLLVVNVGGNKEYWGHILWPPGVPKWLMPILIPVEILGIFTKPFALMMRLFANITAGHIMMLSLVSLVFIFKAIWIGPAVSVPLSLFISLLELLVAALQAYIFTILSALFIGMSVQEHHH